MIKLLDLFIHHVSLCDPAKEKKATPIYPLTKRTV